MGKCAPPEGPHCIQACGVHHFQCIVKSHKWAQYYYFYYGFEFIEKLQKQNFHTLSFSSLWSDISYCNEIPEATNFIKRRYVFDSLFLKSGSKIGQPHCFGSWCGFIGRPGSREMEPTQLRNFLRIHCWELRRSLGNHRQGAHFQGPK